MVSLFCLMSTYFEGILSSANCHKSVAPVQVRARAPVLDRAIPVAVSCSLSSVSVWTQFTLVRIFTRPSAAVTGRAWNEPSRNLKLYNRGECPY